MSRPTKFANVTNYQHQQRNFPASEGYKEDTQHPTFPGTAAKAAMRGDENKTERRLVCRGPSWILERSAFLNYSRTV